MNPFDPSFVDDGEPSLPSLPSRPAATSGADVIDVIDDLEDADLEEIPPLPPSELYESFEALFRYLNAWAIGNGAGFVKKSPYNYREGAPTAYLILCDRGPTRPSASKGFRNASTQKLDCEFKITASKTKKNN